MDTKRYNVYLYIAIVILSVIGVIWGISEYFGEYNKQQEEMKRLFPQVLKEEFEKHQKDLGPVSFDSRPPERQESVIFKSKDGTKEMDVDSAKEKQNIAFELIDRASHSVMMMKNVVQVDSIYARYHHCLAAQSLQATICLLHKAYEKKKVCLGDTIFITMADSLTSSRVGIAHEHEFVLYGTPTIKSIMFGCKNKYFVICLALLLIGFVGYLIKHYHFVIPIYDTNNKKHIYMLTHHVYLNSYNKRLYRVDKPESEVYLNDRDTKLLIAFILTDTHQLNIMQIKQMVWNNSEIKESTVRAAVKALNDNFKIVDEKLRINSIRNGNYRLIFPDF